jgi:hypothetical protein
MPINPFNDSAPLHGQSQLPGRDAELAVLREAFESLDDEQPARHTCFIGPARIGKTSLLLAAETMARDYSVLPVLVPVTDALMAHDGQVLGAALSRAEYHLGMADPGEGGSDNAVRPGRPPDYILDKLADTVELASRRGYTGGIVVLLDQLELVGEDDRALQELCVVLEHQPRWLFVCGAEPSFVRSASTAYPAILRNLRRRRLGRFDHVTDVYQLLTLSQPPSGLPEYVLQFEDLIGFAMAGAMRPFDTTVLAQTAWPDIGGDKRLKLTPRSLRAALRRLRELDDTADSTLHDQVAQQVQILTDLSSDDLERAVFAVNYENMVTSEAAVARVCATIGFHEKLADAAADMRDRVDADITRLCELGLATRTEDVFSSALRPFAEAFLRALAQQDGSEQVHVGPRRYGSVVAEAFLKHLVEMHAGLLSPAPIVLDVQDSGADAGALQPLSPAVEQRNPVQLAAELPFGPVAATDPPGELIRAPVFAITLRFRVFSTEELALQMGELSIRAVLWAHPEPEPVVTRFEALLAEHAGELAAVRLELFDHEVVYIDAALAEELLSLMSPGAVSAQSHRYYRGDDVRGGRDYLARVITPLRTIAQGGTVFWARNALMEAQNNLGFFSCLLDDADAAGNVLSEIPGDYYARRLTEYNLAFVRALRSEYAAAARAIEAILASDLDRGRAVMLLFPPSMDGWRPNSVTWRTAWVEAEYLGGFLRAQKLVYWDLAGAYSHVELAGEIEALEGGAHGGTNRLLGWLRLRSGDRDAAETAFAAALRDPSAADAAREELAFLQARG